MISFELFDNLYEPIVVVNEQSEILYYNTAFLSLFKLTPRNILKLSSLKELFNQYGPKFVIFLEDLIQEKNALSPEISFQLNQQDYSIVLKGSLQFEKYIINIKDLSVEKQLYDKYKAQLELLKNSHEQILQANKLSVLGEMSAQISHEINNPLTVASGNNEIIGFSLELPDIASEKNTILNCHKNITSALDRINRIITNMKEFLHKSEDTKEYISLTFVIDNSIKELQHKIHPHNIEILFIRPSIDYIVLANQVRLEQVFINLISNSIDALMEENIALPQIKIEIKDDIENSNVQILITDNGPGIPTQNKEKIFTTFFTTKEIGKGTGLGLSICKNIIQSHRGSLELLDSKLGACFEIKLPSIVLSNYIEPGWTKILEESKDTYRVLVVDNEPQILNLINNYLKDTPYVFMGATNASEALDIVKRSSIQLIMTDLGMPQIDGEEFSNQIAKNFPNMPIIWISSKDAEKKYKENETKLSLKGFIEKPFTKENVISKIKEVLGV